MLAVMKFFLGQDRDDDSDAEEGEEEGEEKKVKEPSKEDVYKAFHKVQYKMGLPWRRLPTDMFLALLSRGRVLACMNCPFSAAGSVLVQPHVHVSNVSLTTSSPCAVQT